MSDLEFSHLNLRAWPFNVVPSTATATVWVGREEIRRRIERVLRNTERVGNSQVVFLWANFGSGKTHALRYLENRANASDRVVPLYVVIPQGVKSFFDIYRAIVTSAIDSGLVSKLSHHVFAAGTTTLRGDLEQALLQRLKGGYEQKIADAWLQGEKVHLKDLRAIGVSHRLDNVPDAIQALSDLIQLSIDSGERMLLLLDEVQELEELGKKLPECVGGLHKVFDQNAAGLTIVLSFTTGAQSSVKAIMGDAMWSRSSGTLALPALDREEAAEFIQNLLREWSIDLDRAPFPFTVDAISALVDHVAENFEDITPRSLIHSFSAVLTDAEFDIDEGRLSVIDRDYAMRSVVSHAGS